MKRLVLALALLLVFAGPVFAQDPTPRLPFWQDWQFWGVVAAVFFGIPAAVMVVYERRKDTKILTYEIITDSRSVMVKLINVGSVAITADDFFENVEVEFPPKTEVLSARVAKTEPRNRKVTISNSTPFMLEPTLFNPRSSITLEFYLTAGSTNRPTVTGVIENGTVEEWSQRRYETRVQTVGRFLMAVGFFTLTWLGLRYGSFRSHYAWMWVAVTCVYVGSVLWLWHSAKRLLTSLFRRD